MIGPRRPTTKGGYRVQHAPGHPLADGWGYVAEHRMVVFDAELAPICHWCGVGVTWRVDLCVDHLDQDTLNNDLTNLVVSCRPCNSKRTATSRWRQS